MTGDPALGAHGFHVEADEFAPPAVATFLQHADLVEGDAQVGGAEVFVLIVLQAVLVVEVDAAQLVVGEGEGHFIAGVESGEEGVRGLDQALHAAGIVRCVGQGDGVADGRNVGLVGGFVGLRLDPDFDVGIVVEHGVDGLQKTLIGEARVLGLADVGAFARQPEDDGLAIEGAGDVDAFPGAVPGVIAVGGAVGGVGAIDGLAGEPEARSDEFRGETLVGEHGLHLRRLLQDRVRGESVHAGHHVVVMELHALEAQRSVEGEFFLVGKGRAHLGAEGISALADVPGAKGEAVGDRRGHGGGLVTGWD